MTSLKGNRAAQRNLQAKILNEKRTREYRQQVIPNKKQVRQRLRPKDIYKLLENEE
jgi:hypothetical protein